MKRDLKIPKVTFRTRVDEVETDGGCAIGGQWVNKTTDDYFSRQKSCIIQFAWCIYTYMFKSTIT